MATGYTIEIGYNGGDGEWADLKEAALEICDKPLRIYTEAEAFGAPEELDGEELVTYCIAFKWREDMTIEFIEPGHERYTEDCYIHMFESGGDPARTLKNYTRQAFLRLLMAAMHRRGCNINITCS